MAKTITLKLKESEFEQVKSFAKKDNRTISNLLKTAIFKFMEQSQIIDDFEMQNIEENTELVQRIKDGSQDAQYKKGRFVE